VYDENFIAISLTLRIIIASDGSLKGWIMSRRGASTKSQCASRGNPDRCLALNGSRAMIAHFKHVRFAGQMGLSQMTKVSSK